MQLFICYIFFALLLLPVSLYAAPAITCHCFTDRSYDASRPKLADPYFLATTQNSFFAVLFSVDRNTIVMKKQTGVSADDLWIAYWVASESGKKPEVLLSRRAKSETWKEVIEPLRLPVQSTGKAFAAEVAGRSSSDSLAGIIVDGVLIRHRMIAPSDLKILRAEWATNQELILAALVSSKSGRSAVQVYRDVKKGVKSWGGLLQAVRVQPDGMQAEFAALLKAK